MLCMVKRSSMKKFLWVIIVGVSLACSSCIRTSELHNKCLVLKVPQEKQIYGVSHVWDQNGGRYALVTDLEQVGASIRSDGERELNFSYNDKTIGVVKVDKTVPTSLEKKVVFLKLIGGKWIVSM